MTRLMDLIAADENGSEKSAFEVIRVVRKSREKVASLQKHEALWTSFGKGTECQANQLDISSQRPLDSHTKESEDLRTFSLMNMCGLTDEQHKRALSQAKQ